MVLNAVWKRAIAVAATAMSVYGSPVIKAASPFRNNGNINNIHETPIILNIEWIRADRLAWTFAIKEANSAVIVVPIFSPKTIAQATSKGIVPAATMASVNAIAADDDWITTVTRAPKKTNITGPYHAFLKSMKNWTIEESASKDGTACFNSSSPINRIQKPKIAVTHARAFPFDMKRRGAASAKIINA